ncbi:hypothetical protein LXM94_07815 [Rhizobium sp. TRM95111]|uniref:hypothetical protein n=1 Tax=Rhizobium alarense TaxID=2846851 RepID=UPI001F37E90C|nr:hypothetical protein [Rhizobium alarense]MCF3639873.1 hypothetical protein [Rhizobium alarense]
MKFKVDILLDLVPESKGLLIPVFKIEGSNMPFAQEMNDGFEVYDMQPYLDSDNYEYIIPPTLCSTDVGEKGIFAFRSFDDEIVLGDISHVMEYRELYRANFSEFPLLDLQLARICGEPLSTLYSKWNSTATMYFGAEKSKSWIAREFELFQKNRLIWENINSISLKEEQNIITELRQHSFEYLFRWLAVNLSHSAWGRVWLHAFKMSPFDERMHIIAEQWLVKEIEEKSFVRDIRLILFCHLEYRMREDDEGEDFKEVITEYVSALDEEIFDFLHPSMLPYLLIRNIDVESGKNIYLKLFQRFRERIEFDRRFEGTILLMKSHYSDVLG